MATKKHPITWMTKKDVVKLILDSDRVMPAHFTSDHGGKQSRSFLITYEPLLPEAEYQMAEAVWQDIPKLLDTQKQLGESLFNSIIRLFEDYCLAGFILATENQEWHKDGVLESLLQFHIRKLNGTKEFISVTQRPDVELALEKAYQIGWIEAQKIKFPKAKNLKELNKLSRRSKAVNKGERLKSFGAFVFCMAIITIMTMFALWLGGPGEKESSTRMVKVNSQYDAVAYTMEDRRYITIKSIETTSGSTVDFFACGVSKEKLKESSLIIECTRNGKAYFLEFGEE